MTTIIEHKIKNLEKEIANLKKMVRNSEKGKYASIKGLFKGHKITDSDIEDAKNKLFRK